jgi:RNA-directed DNA polymerase
MWAWSTRTEVGAALGDAFLAGTWDREALLERALVVLERKRAPRWLRPLIRRTLATYRDAPVDARRELHAWLDLELEALIQEDDRPPKIAHRLFPEQAMGRAPWPVPPIANVAELAAFLDLHIGELAWLADARGWERSAADERLRHYRYVWVPRPAGLPRLLECPKRHLKELHRRILSQILDRIPPDEAAHGFRRGHSALTHARRHVGHEVVIGFDLEDFFPSVPAGRVYAIFRTAGYPETVAHTLTALCTNVVPFGEWQNRP